MSTFDKDHLNELGRRAWRIGLNNRAQQRNRDAQHALTQLRRQEAVAAAQQIYGRRYKHYLVYFRGTDGRITVSLHEQPASYPPPEGYDDDLTKSALGSSWWRHYDDTRSLQLLNQPTIKEELQRKLTSRLTSSKKDKDMILVLEPNMNVKIESKHYVVLSYGDQDIPFVPVPTVQKINAEYYFSHLPDNMEWWDSYEYWSEWASSEESGEVGEQILQEMEEVTAFRGVGRRSTGKERSSPRTNRRRRSQSGQRRSQNGQRRSQSGQRRSQNGQRRSQTGQRRSRRRS